MNKVTSVNEKVCQDLRNEMNELLSKYGKTIGMEISVGNMSFSNSDIKIKVQATVEGGVTIEESQMSLHLNSMIGRYNLNSKVKHKGQIYELVGYKSRNRKYPFIYSKGGQNFKCDMTQVEIIFSKDSQWSEAV
jgi:hypothetical protein